MPSPISKRERLAHIVGAPHLSPFRQQPKALRILTYHRVVPRPWGDFAFDEQIISASPAAFEAQMRFAARHFDIVSFRDLDACDRAGKAWPSRALIVTFDDGYRDNFTHAFPILRALKIPATIFLTTGHIGAKKLFWWDAIAWCFKTSPLSSAIVPELSEAVWSLGNKTRKRDAIDAALKWCKGVSDAERRDFVARLPDLLSAPITDDAARVMHLNWEEVREMARGGIEFGAHTVTHPILSRVESAPLKREVEDCKVEIEREIGQKTLAFAYPAGTRGRRDEAARAAVEAAGYRFGLSYDEAVELAPDRFEMPRLHVDRDQSLALFRANLLFPDLMLRR